MVGAHHTVKVSTQQQSVQYVESGLLPGHFQPQASWAKNPPPEEHTFLPYYSMVHQPRVHTACPDPVFVFVKQPALTLISAAMSISDGVSQEPYQSFIKCK